MSHGHKVVFVGPSAAGKTSIILQLHRHEFYAEAQPTIGAAFINHDILLPENVVIKLNIWDTAGQERYSSLVPMYSRGAEAVVIVFDFSNPDGFEEAKEWVDKIKSEQSDNTVLYLVPNKIDLVENFDFTKVKEYAEAKGIKVIQTSAKTGENVEMLFGDIARKVNEINPTPPTQIDSKPQRKLKVEKKSCC